MSGSQVPAAKKARRLRRRLVQAIMTNSYISCLTSIRFRMIKKMTLFCPTGLPYPPRLPTNFFIIEAATLLSRLSEFQIHGPLIPTFGTTVELGSSGMASLGLVSYSLYKCYLNPILVRFGSIAPGRNISREHGLKQHDLAKPPGSSELVGVDAYIMY